MSDAAAIIADDLRRPRHAGFAAFIAGRRRDIMLRRAAARADD